jgi:phosphoglycerate dehydrogenase-like enzyme
MSVKAVVWDNIGNVLTGVREWEAWPPHIQERLLAEDPDARQHAVSLRELLAGYDLTVVSAKTLDDVEAEIVDADVLIVHKETLPAATLARATRLGLLQHLGLDYRGLPVQAARARDIAVAAVPLVNYWAVAEHAWAFILDWAKRLPEQQAHMRQRQYQATWGTFPGLKLVSDLTLGLLGFGEIGRAMAHIGRAFGMQVIYWDRERFPTREQRDGARYVGWEELFRTADIVSVHLPHTPATEGLIGSREFGWMKSSALFINTARGKVVNQTALVDALEHHRIGAAALDVYAAEPLPADDPLHHLHERADIRLTLTPHSAWQSPWTWVRDSQTLWLNVKRWLDGQPILYAVENDDVP